MGRAEPGMEGMEGMDGGGRGGKWCRTEDFSGSLAVDQAGMLKISAFIAVIGRNRTFSCQDVADSAESAACCQSWNS